MRKVNILATMVQCKEERLVSMGEKQELIHLSRKYGRNSRSYRRRQTYLHKEKIKKVAKISKE